MTSQIKAEIRLSRTSGNQGRGAFYIELADEASGSTFFIASLTELQFVDLLTNRSVNVEAAWSPSLVGMLFDIKEEVITLSTYTGPYADKAKIAAHFKAQLTAYEVDGWTARLSTCMNVKNIVRWKRSEPIDGVRLVDVRVTFTRYMRPDGTPVVGDAS